MCSRQCSDCGRRPYLHDGVEGRVGSDAEVGAGHIVTNGGRQHAHRDAKLLVVGSGLIQLQQGLKGLMVTVVLGLDHMSGTVCFLLVELMSPYLKGVGHILF